MRASDHTGLMAHFIKPHFKSKFNATTNIKEKYTKYNGKVLITQRSNIALAY